ncbi:MAG: AEC family transporter [Firmicutes bacterium]|nr:AEC family transporter [Bacillota bacterium]
MAAILLIRKIVQLFLIMGLGVIIVKAGVVRSEDSRVLSKLALYLLVPFVILKAFQLDMTPDIRNGMLFAFLMSAVMHSGQIGIALIGKKLVRLDTVEQNSVIYPNAVNLILPLVTYMLGPEWIIYSSAVASVQLIFLWTHCVGSFAGWENMSFKRMILNVNTLSVLGGIVLLITGIRFPAIVNEVADSMGSMLGPFAMLIVGMLLAETDMKEMVRRKRLFLVVFLRMIFCPALFLILMKLIRPETFLEGGHEIALTILLTASSPTATTVTQFSQLYDRDANYASAINITTTLVCIVTMPLFVYLYEIR